MELAVTLLIVALAAAVVLRRVWRLFHEGGKSGCGSGCGSCPVSSAGAVEKPLVTLGPVPKRAK
jgi:hypothetical protein